MADDESWRLEMRKTIKGCLVRLDKMMDQIRRSRTDVIASIQKLEKVIGSDNNTQRDDLNLVMEEAEAKIAEAKIVEVEIEEVKVGAQASMDTKTKVAILKIQAQVEEPYQI